MLPSGDMIEEYDLCVLVSLYLHPLCAVAWRVLVWIHIYHFPVSFVPEQQSRV